MKTYLETTGRCGRVSAVAAILLSRRRACGAVGFPPQPVGQVPLLRHGRRSASVWPGAAAACSPWARECSSGSVPTSWRCTSKIADAAQSGSAVPDFMQIAGKPNCPRIGNRSPCHSSRFWLILIVPALVATVLGSGVFKRRVKGAYFAIPLPGSGRGLRDSSGRPTDDR